MSLVFDRVNENIPQTHILIIGVGKYPYLPGGDKAKEQTSEFVKSLKQLTSTTRSATYFCDAAIGLHTREEWLTPLGSIDMLTDVPFKMHDTDEMIMEEPTFENIEVAYHAWKKRCNYHEDSVAIFYFSGHGYGSAVEQYILSSDTGKIPENPFRQTINFTKTRTAFHGCLAKTQLFFIDACRIVPVETLINEFDPISLDSINQLQSECKHPLTILATAANALAYGKKNEPSFFTKAVVKGLTSYGARNDDDGWHVSSGTFSQHINKWLGMEKSNNSQHCIISTGLPAKFIKLSSPPKVYFHVNCNPAEALGFAWLTCEGNALYNRKPEIVPWEFEAEAGLYIMKASFPGNEYENVMNPTNIEPPSAKHIFAW